MPPNEKTEEVKPAVKPKEKEEDKTDLVSYFSSILTCHCLNKFILNINASLIV